MCVPDGSSSGIVHCGGAIERDTAADPM